MGPPSQLAIATSSLQRLVKEEASYQKELISQQKRIDKLENSHEVEEEGEEGNRDFKLKQERKALEETKAVLPNMEERILSAKEKLEGLLQSQRNEDDEEVKKARKVIAEIRPTEKA